MALVRYVDGMPPLFRLSWFALIVAVLPARAAEFSKSITPEDFAAAGLSKLTPDELAHLDALVSGRQKVETTRVREETTAKVKAEVAATPPAQEPSLLHRMKVVLTPGTDIDYERVETKLVGSFRGYDPGSILTLANGQQWRVTEGTFWAPAKDADKPRKVVIEPGALGSFFLAIEDGGRPKVKIVRHGN